jgi:GT2 family glycosyltransferase/ubiquinone/menaquinone biosynthesis C-methylase UbiE
MKYTGERYLSSLDAPETSYEHWHRYLYSTLFCKDKVVLDVACGEGYGSYLLSKYSKKVVGIDIDYDVINFASREYINNNLEFIVGNANNLPFKGKCLFDLIVSFETIEHIDEQNQIKLLTEVKRLLKPGGVLIISTPNKALYTDVLNNRNKFHVKEFYLNEFNDFLKKYFQDVKIMGQKIYSNSYIWDKDKKYGDFVEFELTYENNRFLPSKNGKKILYAIAVCSDEKLDEIQPSILLDISDRLTIVRDECIAQLQNKIYKMGNHYAAQLFIDTGKGTSEEQSILRKVSGKEEELEFDVSSYKGIVGLRFDPLNDVVRLRLEEIVIIDDKNMGHRVLEYTTNCSYNRDNDYTFETNDPIISFKVRDINNPDKVIIRLKYLSLGDEVNRYIVKLKQDEIEKRDGEIREKESVLKQRDAVINTLKDTLEQKNQQIKNLENEIHSLDHRLTRTDEQLLSLRESNDQKDEKIKKLESDIQLLEKQFKKILDSWSWKITKPLREIYSIIPGKSKKNQILKPAVDVNETNDTLNGIYINCDSIEIVFDSLIVLGWALSRDSINKIEVYTDDILVGNAQYGFPRLDVEALFPHIKDSKNSGFLFYTALDDRQLSNSRLYVIIKAEDRHRERKEITKTITTGDNRYIEYCNKTGPTGSYLLRMGRISHTFQLMVRISIIILVNKKTAEDLYATIKSIMNQVYANLSIFVFFEKDLQAVFLKTYDLPLDKLKVYPLAELCQILAREESEFLCFIQPGVILLPHAFFEVVKKINIERNIDLIYADEDKLVDNKRKRPFFKPNWSPELLLSMNYIGHFFVIKKELFASVKCLKELSPPELLYDLLLRISEISVHITHIPRVLYSDNSDMEFHVEKTREILEDALVRRKIDGEVLFLTSSNLFRARKKIVNGPLVSIIISTAKNPGINIKPCLSSIVEKSTYKNYEIILVDNSFGEISLTEIKKIVPTNIPLKMIKYNKEFNFSAVNNAAARKAGGKFLILLNDDTEVISPGWIESMLEHAQAPDIGAVGAKLLYKNNTIQHAGMFLLDHGGGGGHWFKYCMDKDFGFHGLLNTARPCSAVTFACVMIPKKVFDSLNGLDEKLKVECNDVDFCLRAINAGFRVIWTPFARLYHKESITRKSLSNSGQITNPDNYKFFRDRWRNVLEKGDPFYNPNLSLDSEIYSVNNRPVLIEHYDPTHKTPDWLDKNSILAVPRFNPEIDEKILKGFEEFINSPLLVGISPLGEKSIQQWPLDYFSRLMGLLVEEKNANLIVFGEEEEKSTFKKTFYSKKRKERLKFFGGKWFNNQFLSLLKKCHLFIGTRNEYVHSAAQLGIPTLTILSGDILPWESHPPGEKTMTIRIAVDCSPCGKESIEQCPHDLKCLKFLWPQKVMEAVNQLLIFPGD